MNKSSKDNIFLVEFDFLIDLDLAIFKLIKEEYSDNFFVNKDILNINDEKEIISLLLNRNHINPLELLIKDMSSNELYLDLINNHLDKLLKYAMACDTFGLMITWLNEASSIDITVLCKNKLQEDFIKNLNNNLKTIVIPKRQDVPIAKYTGIFVKHFPYILEYNNLQGKHIYIAAARYNMNEHNNLPSSHISVVVNDVNIVHFIDLYVGVKVKYIRKEEGSNE